MRSIPEPKILRKFRQVSPFGSDHFFKIHVTLAAGRGYSYFHLYMCVFVYVFICVTPPGQAKNDTDQKFGTHTPIDLI